MHGNDWHSQEQQAVLAALRSSDEGLSAQEAIERLKRYGYNRLPTAAAVPPWRRLLAQFDNLLIYVLLVAAVVTALIGHWIDSGVILGVVVINAIIGFIQEGKAEQALAAINHLVSQQAVVRRNGHSIAIAAETLVPGDIVALQSGDRVPADLRLIQLRDLQIDEAMLTGESLPVAKQVTPLVADCDLADRSNMAYAGTTITSGRGLGVVVATAEATELGRISQLMREVSPLTTPLLQKMAQFARSLTFAIIAISLMTFIFGIAFHQYSWMEMFLAGVGLAVAAIPEGLPAIVTITLAIGVQRMAARRALIRRLPAVETLGSVTVICSDKTGTLTRNEMMVQAIACRTRLLEVTGSGYIPQGEIRQQGGQGVAIDGDLLALIRAGLLCNDATLHDSNQQWQIEGDPTEGALVVLAAKAGLDTVRERLNEPRRDEIPFESERQFMATLHHDHAGHAAIYLKGSPEQILGRCTREREQGSDRPLNLSWWQQQMEQMAARGLRLLAIAERPLEGHPVSLNLNDCDGGFTLLGLTGLIDPPRDEAIHAVARCQQAGIMVKMITGDHAITARAIASQMGLGEGEPLTGREIDTLSNEALRQRMATTHVFARTSPEHKLRLVAAMQANGDVVAMTGDGVNDAPALRRADVGIAMGKKGTDVTREAAEMVLTDDNFSSIAEAVEEGRTVYDNLKKAILFILPTNGGQALIIIAAILFGTLLPITPVQILWVNMITAVTLALALAFEPTESGVMRRPPRPPAEPLLTPFLLWRIGFVSLVLVVGTFILFQWAYAKSDDIHYARTVAVNTLVLFEIFYLFSARYLVASTFNRQGLLGNRIVWLAVGVAIVFQLLFTYNSVMQMLFATVPLSLDDWLTMLMVTPLVYLLIEMEKWWLARRRGGVRVV
jgi:magnesium-transporting ATPase (P-type)